MYHKAYGIIETLAPLHVGASAGEETGNLNLIFRDQFTQTGIIPGSSIRGRFRADMRLVRQKWLEEELIRRGEKIPATFSFINAQGQEETRTKLEWLEMKAKQLKINVPPDKNENLWYGHEAVKGEADSTTESLVKFEYASILWLPVFCPGQPIVWVSCPRLLKRYKRIVGETIKADLPAPYTSSQKLERNKLFFNFGFITIDNRKHNLSEWFPDNQERPAVVVGDDEIAMIHDMALYRQTRVTLEKEEKRVEDGKFFNTEALPEETILVFPIAHKLDKDGNSWKPFTSTDIYLGGLESIGFGHCQLTLTLKGV
ncbi:RAMP superfamily CRISPR-associated protein [Argonema antarcticum]|uniref:RAMP superfamily CRISPR-associated protein n=1 Tax=Argonema antarcticum TaxID=2942763 RepID=UPI002013540A|nr:RAMP superfamily CRISPR-associated protein [Argonema antarcticum]MCL1475016.1 RAMP superfamily CRISPR-associated protein [Argonema antarcticum A004/B2]